MLPKAADGGHRDSTVVRIDSSHSPRGAQGEKYLASGVRVAMRLWDQEEQGEQSESEREYEVVGFVLSGHAELHIEGQVVSLRPGDSYVVPRGARHSYRIIEPFSAVEATSPPCQVHGRDEPRPQKFDIEEPPETPTAAEEAQAEASEELADEVPD